MTGEPGDAYFDFSWQLQDGLGTPPQRLAPTAFSLQLTGYLIFLFIAFIIRFGVILSQKQVFVNILYRYYSFFRSEPTLFSALFNTGAHRSHFYVAISILSERKEV